MSGWEVILTYQVPQPSVAGRGSLVPGAGRGLPSAPGGSPCWPLCATAQMGPKVGTVSTWLVTAPDLPPLHTPTGLTAGQSGARLGRGVRSDLVVLM